MVKDLKNLNQITVNTWRWLKVNYTDIDKITIPDNIYENDSNLLESGIKEYIEDNYENVKDVISKFDDYNEKYMWLIHNGYVYSFEDGILTGTVFSQGYQSRLVVPAVKGTRVVLEFES